MLLVIASFVLALLPLTTPIIALAAQVPVSTDPVVLLAVVAPLIGNSLPMASDIPVIQVRVQVSPAVPQVIVIVPKIVQTTLQAHLLIPSINVDAVIKAMGVTSAGAMAVPNNRVDVGWYSLGTKPGDTGSAVIGGHDNYGGGDGAFVDLNRLKVGDVLSVVDAKGVSTSFVVREMKTFAATDENTGIFASTSGAHLNLITCSGVWDAAAESYTTRLVVFTDKVVV